MFSAEAFHSGGHIAFVAGAENYSLFCSSTRNKVCNRITPLSYSFILKIVDL